MNLSSQQFAKQIAEAKTSFSSLLNSIKRLKLVSDKTNNDIGLDAVKRFTNRNLRAFFDGNYWKQL